MADINSGYDVLGNETLRADYDCARHASVPPPDRDLTTRANDARPSRGLIAVAVWFKTLLAVALILAACLVCYGAVADVNAKAINEKVHNNNGWSGLMLAAAAGDVLRLKAQIAAGADVNAKSNAGDTPLIWAATFGHLDCVKVLIAAGSDVKTMDKGRYTALALVLANRHP
jgi:hypothetical protein